MKMLLLYFTSNLKLVRGSTDIWASTMSLPSCGLEGSAYRRGYRGKVVGMIPISRAGARSNRLGGPSTFVGGARFFCKNLKNLYGIPYLANFIIKFAIQKHNSVNDISIYINLLHLYQFITFILIYYRKLLTKLLPGNYSVISFLQ